MPFGIGLKKPASFVQCDAFTDTGDDVLQFASFRAVIEDIIGGEQRHLRLASNLSPNAQPPQIVAAKRHDSTEPDTVGCLFCQIL